MHRDPSVLVWLPDYEKDLAPDAIMVHGTGNTIYLDLLREGARNIREYVSQGEVCNYPRFSIEDRDWETNQD